MAMTAAERRAAQKELQETVGALARQSTDLLNQAKMDGLYPTDVYPKGLPDSLARVLSTNQIAAVEYGPAPQAPAAD